MEHLNQDPRFKNALENCRHSMKEEYKSIISFEGTWKKCAELWHIDEIPKRSIPPFYNHLNAKLKRFKTNLDVKKMTKANKIGTAAIFVASVLLYKRYVHPHVQKIFNGLRGKLMMAKKNIPEKMKSGYNLYTSIN